MGCLLAATFMLGWGRSAYILLGDHYSYSFKFLIDLSATKECHILQVNYLEEKMEYAQDLKKAYKTSAILYVAFMLSLVIYLVVFEVLKARIPDFQGIMEKIDFPWLRYAFYALGLVQIFLIKFI